MSEKFDAIIIGAGQGGFPAATTFAGKGWKTALIEREHVGGTCVNEGCTPTKTMVASARVAHLARRGGDYGVGTGSISVDMEKVRKRKRDIVESFRGGSEQRVAATENLTLFEGQARFADNKSIEIAMRDGTTRVLDADTVIINTGASPAVPPVDGLSDVPYLDSTSIMELGEVPEHLLVMGGGYIGLEFGQMFARFGSNVTIVNRGPRLAAREDPDVAEEVRKILTGDGAEVVLNASATAVAQTGSGAIRLAVDQDGTERVLEGSHLLVATGRRPNTADLGLDATDVTTDKRGFIQVNDRLETGVDGVYAIGDCKGGPAFTHISYADFRIVNRNLFGDGAGSIAGRLVPYAMFIDPQLGRVGMNEKEAEAAGIAYEVKKMPMEWVARALETDEARGMMKAIIDPKSERILGFTCLGIEGGEIAGAVQIAMMAGLPYTALRDGTFAHPTIMESLNNLFSL